MIVLLIRISTTPPKNNERTPRWIRRYVAQPEHQHITLLVNLIIAQRASELLERLRAALAAHGGPDWETQLAPRVVLGFWSQLDIKYAKATLPRCPRAYVGWGTMIGERNFWDECTVFAIDYPVLSFEGRK